VARARNFASWTRRALGLHFSPSLLDSRAEKLRFVSEKGEIERRAGDGFQEEFPQISRIHGLENWRATGRFTD